MATVEEIYKGLLETALYGVMLHDELNRLYCFLGMTELEHFHREQSKEEYCNYLELYDYFLEHHNKLLKIQPPTFESIIPGSWYSHEKKDVDTSTRTNYTKLGFEKWTNWEKTAKKKFSEAYRNLFELDEISDLIFVSKYIINVDQELSNIDKLANN